ncbi:MAG: hypothetical protein RPT25_00650 [Cycloclasticus sp.]|jgi:hypothetical protein
MAKPKQRSKERYVGIPFNVLKSEMGRTITAIEMKLIIHLGLQYNGNNNGMMSPTFSLMKEYGWSSTSTLYKARKGLEHKGFIITTKIGKKVKGDCTLVAFTWRGIDESDKWPYREGVKASPVPLNYFKKPKSEWGVQPAVAQP